METMTPDDVQLDDVTPALKSCPLFQEWNAKQASPQKMIQ